MTEIFVTLGRLTIKSSIKTLQTYRPFIQYSDWKLLELIGEEDSQVAKAEFFDRYKSFLLQVCRKRCAHFDGGDHLAEDIFQNTIIKALKGVNSLKKRISETTPDIPRIIKSWLVVIAKNELRDFLNKNPDEKYLSDPLRSKSSDVQIGIDSEVDELLDEKPSIQKVKLDEALTELTEREKHILMAYMEYFNPSEPNRHLPDKVIDNLCAMYSVTPENLRQIKGRALKKLFDKLQTNH